jgi:methylglutaconyl-CoA hydratase
LARTDFKEKEEEVIFSKENHVAVMTLNRPKAMNSLNGDLCARLIEMIDGVEQDEGTRAVIITGSGQEAFCAGIDLKERKEMNEEELKALRRFKIFPLFQRLAEIEKPLIAAINGLALGGGAEIALICDIRIASENAKFGQTEVKWGIIPGAGACQRLPLIVGMGNAKELLFTGKIIDAQEGRGLGLFNRVTTSQNLMGEAFNIARQIAENGPIAVGQIKRAVNFGADNELALAFDREASEICYHTRDRLEGMAAFNEKRKPRYTGS